MGQIGPRFSEVEPGDAPGAPCLRDRLDRLAPDASDIGAIDRAADRSPEAEDVWSGMGMSAGDAQVIDRDLRMPVGQLSAQRLHVIMKQPDQIERHKTDGIARPVSENQRPGIQIVVNRRCSHAASKAGDVYGVDRIIEVFRAQDVGFLAGTVLDEVSREPLESAAAAYGYGANGVILIETLQGRLRGGEPE